MCLSCGYVGCGREVEQGEHASKHAKATGHGVAMSLNSVHELGCFCYSCEDWTMTDSQKGGIAELRARLERQRGRDYNTKQPSTPTSSQEGEGEGSNGADVAPLLKFRNKYRAEDKQYTLRQARNERLQRMAFLCWRQVVRDRKLAADAYSAQRSPKKRPRTRSSSRGSGEMHSPHSTRRASRLLAVAVKLNKLQPQSEVMSPSQPAVRPSTSPALANSDSMASKAARSARKSLNMEPRIEPSSPPPVTMPKRRSQGKRTRSERQHNATHPHPNTQSQSEAYQPSNDDEQVRQAIGASQPAAPRAQPAAPRRRSKRVKQQELATNVSSPSSSAAAQNAPITKIEQMPRRQSKRVLRRQVADESDTEEASVPDTEEEAHAATNDQGEQGPKATPRKRAWMLWTDEEKRALALGVRDLGTGRWQEILDRGNFQPGRHAQQLRYKWANLQKHAATLVGEAEHSRETRRRTRSSSKSNSRKVLASSKKGKKESKKQASKSKKYQHKPAPPQSNFAGRTGLRNLGNSCFVNSVVQALKASRAFYGLMVALPDHLPAHTLDDSSKALGAGWGPKNQRKASRKRSESDGKAEGKNGNTKDGDEEASNNSSDDSDGPLALPKLVRTNTVLLYDKQVCRKKAKKGKTISLLSQLHDLFRIMESGR